jgi:hypothetical protein
MRFFYGLGWFALGSIAACSSKGVPTAPMLADCTTCVPLTTTGGSQGAGTGGSEADDAGDTPSDDAAPSASDAGAVKVKLSLVRMLSEATFSKDVVQYTGPVKVTSFGPAGDPVDTGDTGVILSQDLDGVASGANWFAVEDPSQMAQLAATLQPVDVGTSDPIVTLTALNAGQLAATNIDGDLLMSPVQGQATIVLVFQKGGQSVSGVSVTGVTDPAVVSYYTGTPFPYQSKAKNTDSTGADSTVLIAHVPAAAQFPKMNTVTLSYTVGNQAAVSLDVNVAQTFVTWMLVDVK